MLTFPCLETERKNFWSLNCEGKRRSQWEQMQREVSSVGKAGQGRHDLTLAEREEEIVGGKTPLPKLTGCRVQSLCKCFLSGPKFGLPSSGIASASGSSVCLAQGLSALLRLRVHPSNPHPKQRMSNSLWLSPSLSQHCRLNGSWVMFDPFHSQIFNEGKCSAFQGCPFCSGQAWPLVSTASGGVQLPHRLSELWQSLMQAHQGGAGVVWRLLCPWISPSAPTWGVQGHKQSSEHTMLKLVLLENTWSQMTNIPETPHFQEITEPCRESFLTVTAAKAVIL